MTYRFEKNDRICFGAETFRFLKLTDGIVHLRNAICADDRLQIAIDEWPAYMSSPGYRLDVGYYDGGTRQKTRDAHIRAEANSNSKSARARSVRYALVMAYETLHAKGRVVCTDESIALNMTEIINQAFLIMRNFKPDCKIDDLPRFISPRSLRRYIKIYAPARRNWCALVDRRIANGKDQSVFCKETEALLSEEVQKYAHEDQPTKTVVVQNTRARFREENRMRQENGLRLLAVPSDATILRRINDLDQFEVDCVRLGTDEARRKHSMPAEGLKITIPLERVEIDEWNADVFTLFDGLGLLDKLPEDMRKRIPQGRCWVVIAIDKATRVVLGLVVTDNPSSDAALAVLEQVLSDKSALANACGAKRGWEQHGRPQSIATDTGSAFISEAFVSALNELEIKAEYGPVKTPQSRGTVERFFNTFAGSLMPRLSGRTYASVMEKQETDNHFGAVLTDDELTRILIGYIVDVYHVTPHGGLAGQLPINAWKEKTKIHGLNLLPGEEQIATALGVKMQRKLSNRGIRFCGLYYSSDKLRKLYSSTNERDFTIRVRAADLGFIMVLIGHEWVRADCHNASARGVALDDWVNECRKLKYKYQQEAALHQDVIDDAFKRIHECVDNAKSRANITEKILSPKYIDQLERNLFHGLQGDDHDVIAPHDPDVVAGEIIGARPSDARTQDDAWFDDELVDDEPFDGETLTNVSVGSGQGARIDYGVASKWERATGAAQKDTHANELEPKEDQTNEPDEANNAPIDDDNARGGQMGHPHERQDKPNEVRNAKVNDLWNAPLSPKWKLGDDQ